jgi:hypothetical protein
MKKYINKLLAGCVLAMSTLSAYSATTIHAFEADSLQQIVASQKGKSFVLIVWALDCVYCQASMKALMQERRKRKDLHVITLATDPVADAEAAALMKKKLESFGMTNNAWAFGEAPSEQLRYAIDPQWRGEIPRTYWFDAQGNSVAHSGVVTSALIGKMSERRR